MANNNAPSGLDSILNSGFLFGQRYRPESLIGRGGMANVYLGTDTRLQRRVAIKALRPDVAIDKESRKRFQREAHSVSAMGHPNIVRVYDAGEEFIPAASTDIPIPYIVMEYIDGKILRKLMDAGAFDPKVAVHITLGILEALEVSHGAGIIHRDIKPGNIMITQSGVVKVCDFGIAQAIEDPTNDPSAIVGTAQYFSPEQAKGEVIDARSDLYSVAVVLFEMVTGTPLFTGDTSVAIAFQHVTQTAPRARSRRPELSPELDLVIARGLEKDRSRRFASATEFAAAIRAVPALTGPGRADLAATPPTQPPAPVEPPAPVRPAASAATVGVAPVVGEATPFVEPTTTKRRIPFLPVKSSQTTTTDTDGSFMDFKDLKPLLDSDSPPKGAMARWILLGAAGVLVVASVVVGMMYWVLTLNTTTTVQGLSITMPDVTGAQTDLATEQLQRLGFTVTRRVESSDTVAEGSVISTSPEAGVHLAAGEIVTLVESTGPVEQDIPSISLLELSKAKTAIEAAGFVVGDVKESFSPDAKKGIVIGSTPEAGKGAPAGTVVNILVSNGQVKVPNVVGMTVGKATKLLQGADLQLLVTVTPDTSCTGQEIGSQSLAPGAAPQHSKMTLVYCAG
ncbi:MAG: Stk1 family Ser/Thr kinase [Actinomycetota bacterium]|jgi:serine/threonine-protein kinase